MTFASDKSVRRDVDGYFGALTPTAPAHVATKAYVDAQTSAGAMPAGVMAQFIGPPESTPAGWLLAQGQAVSRTTYATLFALFGTTYGAGNGTTTFNMPDLRGRIPVGYTTADTEFNTLGKTGGEKTHVLTSTEMPSHTHVQNAHTHVQNAHNHTQDAHGHTGSTANNNGAHTHTYVGPLNNTTGAWNYNPVGGGSVSANTRDSGSDGVHGHTLSITNTTATNQSATATNQNATAVNQTTGGDAAHNNLQPYITVNYIVKY